jgi:hypothetical protein
MIVNSAQQSLPPKTRAKATGGLLLHCKGSDQRRVLKLSKEEAEML